MKKWGEPITLLPIWFLIYRNFCPCFDNKGARHPDTSIHTVVQNYKKYNNFYYVNTNEVPAVELLREKLIYSHVKISPHNKLCLSHKKKTIFKISELFRYFIGVCIINRTLHGQLEIRNICSTLPGKFLISAWPCAILYRYKCNNVGLKFHPWFQFHYIFLLADVWNKGN